MRRTSIWQKVAWPLLLWVLWLPTMVHAGNEMENSYHWMITPSGVNTVDIQIPVYDCAGLDGFVDNGYLYITPDGEATETVLYFYSKQKSGDNCWVWVKKSVDGEMVLTRDNGYSSIAVSSTEKSCELSQKLGTDLYFMYINWVVPDKYRGKRCRFSWYVHKHGNKSANEKEIKLTPTYVSFNDTPAPTVATIMDPILGYDAAHAGQTMMIYTMTSSDINSLTAHYKEVNGATYKSRSMALGKEMSGFIYLPSDKCIKDFSITARYMDTEGTERSSQSTPFDLPTLHMPYGFVATLQADGSAQLRWECKDKNWADISTDDIWDIQRNTSGDSSSEGLWQSIGQATYEGNDTVYTFTDESFATGYEGHVYYRVRRASTAMWDWKPGTFAMAALTGVVRLPAVGTASVTKGVWNDTRHQANFTFAFGQKEQYDKDGRLILRTAEDWEAFARLVNTEGKTSLNAIMAADINLGTSRTMVGTNDRRYSGTFDGNGHTLTVLYDSVDVEYAAPFSVVGTSVIKNLHVTGKNVSSKKFAAGIVGRVYGSLLQLSNSRCSAIVGSTISGDATNGGLVALVSQHCNVQVTNCLFDGQLLGKSSNSIGGLIGYSYTAPRITHSLFSPLAVDIETKMEGCKPLARTQSDAATTDITNCYYTVLMDGSKTCIIDGKTFYILRNAEDWDSFIANIVSAGGTSEVNAIMAADISTVYSAGYRSGIAFKGIFDGNGHTLTVEITGGNNDYIAPFSRIQGATIKNLHVTGSVRGGMHSAGLVGSALGTENNILNCHVSVNVTTTKTHAGGIMGHGHSAKNSIKYCVFDGSVTATAFQAGSYAGAFMGWEDGDTSNEVWHNLENGTYNSFDHAGLNFKADGGVWGGTNNWHNKNWSEGNKVGNLSPDELVGKLGSNEWHIEAGLVVPIQRMTEVGQGVDASEMEQSLLAERLGNQWELCGNSVQPIMATQDDALYASTIWSDDAKLILNIDKLVGDTVRYTERKELSREERETGRLSHDLITSCVDYRFRFDVEQGTSKITPIDTLGTVVSSGLPAGESFRFDNNVQIDSLQVVSLQSTVSLAWYTSGLGDFYRILRRDKQTDETVILEDDYVQTSYIDKTPQPQHVYEYTIEGVNNCEGRHVSSISQDGWCSPMGMVRGYIRLKNGTAQAGVKVIAEPTSDTARQGGKTRWTLTDSTGFFEIDSLVYQGAGSYNILAETTGDQGSYSTYTANFNEWSNLATNVVLTLDEYYLTCWMN